jgi:hypothetical protein
LRTLRRRSIERGLAQGSSWERGSRDILVIVNWVVREEKKRGFDWSFISVDTF